MHENAPPQPPKKNQTKTKSGKNLETEFQKKYKSSGKKQPKILKI